jgi:hypothetical protein
MKYVLILFIFIQFLSCVLATDCLVQSDEFIAYIPEYVHVSTNTPNYPDHLDFQGLRIQIAANGQAQVRREKERDRVR